MQNWMYCQCFFSSFITTQKLLKIKSLFVQIENKIIAWYLWLHARYQALVIGIFLYPVRIRIHKQAGEYHVHKTVIKCLPEWYWKYVNKYKHI